LSASTWPPENLPDGRPGGTGGVTPPATEAAVLVPLFGAGEGEEPHLVLTRRRSDLRRHAGEISFPGGRRDPEDSDLLATALREAEEEIGLDPSQATILGELPSVSTFATGYVIHPFVGAIPAGVAWRLSAREVDAVIELSLASVRAGRTRTQMERRGFTFETDAFIVDEHLIWGATARIIDLLLARLETGAGGGLALAPAGEPG
jgi:8-oxo-dGTP pyrophosphatase MutT (NUDIX family)